MSWRLTALIGIAFAAVMGTAWGVDRLGTTTAGESAALNIWGDVDCTEGVTSIDALLDLQYVAGFPIGSRESCPNIGSAVRVQEAIHTCPDIQQRIEELPPEGGQIVIPGGTFTCSSPIVIDRDNVVLRGQGASTLLRLAASANSPVIVIGQTVPVPLVSRRNIGVFDIVVDGNRAGQTAECWGGSCATHPIRNNGIAVRHVEDVVIEGVTVKAARSGGVVIERGSRRVTVRDLTSFNNQFDGLAAYETEGSLFSGLRLYGNLAAGLSFDLNFNNNIISDAVIEDNGTIGVFMQCARDNVFYGLLIRNSTEHGIFLAADSASPVCSAAAAGNTFTSIVVSGSGQQADPTTEGFCVSQFIGGAGLCANNQSAVDNLVVAAQFIENVGGCIIEADPDNVVDVGTLCR